MNVYKNMKTSWPTKKLGEVCEVVGGGTPSTTVSEYWNGGIVWITPKDLGKLDSFDILGSFKKITKAGLKNSSSKLLPKEAVVLSSRAPIGYVAIAEVPLATNQGCRSFICDESKIYNWYLLYFLLIQRDYLNSLGGGSTFKEISGSKLKKVEIPLPPIGEQRRIVAKLEKVLGKIKEAKKLREEAQSAAAALLPAELHKIFEEGKKNGWEEKELQDIVEITSSKRIYKSEYAKEGIPFYRTKEISELDDGRTIKTELFITQKRFNEVRKKFGAPQEDDILLTAIGTIGKIYVVKKDDVFYFKDGNVLWLKELNGIDSIFFKMFLKQALYEMQTMSAGSAYKALPIIKLKKLKIPLPPIAEQKKIVARLDALAAEITALREAQSHTASDFAALEQSVLHQAFSASV